MNYGVITEVEKLKTKLGNVVEKDKNNVTENKRRKVSFHVFVFFTIVSQLFVLPLSSTWVNHLSQ